MKNVIFTILACGLLLFTSCKTSSILSTSSTKYEATNPNEISIFLSKKPTKEYEEIGKVGVEKYSNIAMKRSEAKIQKALKEKASSIGGHAIINITEDFASISGIVIRYTN